MSTEPQPARTLRLILGDQLNGAHSWFARRDADVLYVMMEVASETGYARHHVQKVLAFFGAMRRFAELLQGRGHRVLYIPLDDPRNEGSFAANLAWVQRLTGATVLAIARDDGDVTAPTGHEVLREGDVLAVAGPHEAAALARALLLSGPSAPAHDADDP